ncbi:MAG: hypothetical protein IJ816_01630 [Alloprevotella sp.]|nr:hypothetical protein [Alloprevotella sp.]
MKQFYSLALTFLMAFCAISFTACDNEEEGTGNGDTAISIADGQVTISFGSASAQLYYAYDAEWQTGHQVVSGTVLDNLTDGATFVVNISDNAPSDLQEILGDYIYEILATWQFETPDAISVGSELNIDKSHWNNGTYDNAGYFCTDCEGSVKVRSIQGNDITLSFQNFKFNYISNFRVGNSSYTDVVVNGDIKFTYQAE